MNVINPRMLVLGRESRGISQSELAQSIKLSQPKLSQAEKGGQTLNVKDLKNLAERLNYPIGFFYQSTPSFPVSHYYYRRRVTLSQKVLNQMESLIKIYRQNIDLLMESVDLFNDELRTFNPSKDSPEEIARKVRYLFKIPSGPIDNLNSYVEKQGIIVVKADFFHDKIDGLSTISEKNIKIIFLNQRKSNDRQKFSLAHELGHILMHFDIPEIPNDVEEQANRFASELLMPSNEIGKSLSNLSMSKLADLKRYWKVSMKSILYKAKTLGYIDLRQYRNFQITFSKMGISRNEPISIPEEKPQLLKIVLNLHLNELEYTEKQLASYLNLPLDEFTSRFIENERPKIKILRT